MTVRVYSHDSYEMATYPEGVKAVRSEEGVLQIYSDRAKTDCIAMHNVDCWAYVQVSDGTENKESDQKFPYAQGEGWVLGPQVFVLDGVITYQGDNYYRQQSQDVS